jgi:hypothetical protein
VLRDKVVGVFVRFTVRRFTGCARHWRMHSPGQHALADCQSDRLSVRLRIFAVAVYCCSASRSSCERLCLRAWCLNIFMSAARHYSANQYWLVCHGLSVHSVCYYASADAFACTQMASLDTVITSADRPWAPAFKMIKEPEL